MQACTFKFELIHGYIYGLIAFIDFDGEQGVTEHYSIVEVDANESRSTQAWSTKVNPILYTFKFNGIYSLELHF